MLLRGVGRLRPLLQLLKDKDGSLTEEGDDDGEDGGDADSEDRESPGRSPAEHGRFVRMRSHSKASHPGGGSVVGENFSDLPNSRLFEQ